MTLNSLQEQNLEKIVQSREFREMAERLLARGDSMTYYVNDEGRLIVECVSQVAAYAL